MQKYTFVDKTKNFDNGFYSATLRQIVALKDFGHVTAGTLGGFIECEANLSQDGLCWVAKDAIVYGGGTKISGDAWVGAGSEIGRGTKIQDTAHIVNSTCMESIVGGNSKVCDSTSLIKTTVMNAILYGCVLHGLGAKNIVGGQLYSITTNGITSSFDISGDPLLAHVSIDGDVKISGNPKIYYAELRGNITIGGDTIIRGPEIRGECQITGGAIYNDGTYEDAVIAGNDDFMVIGGIPAGVHCTIYRTRNGASVIERYFDQKSKVREDRKSFDEWVSRLPDITAPFADTLRKRFGVK